jgi:hypothetical protein
MERTRNYVQERAQDGTLQIIHCPSKEMLADGLTKALPRIAFEKMVMELGLVQEQGGVLNDAPAP